MRRSLAFGLLGLVTVADAQATVVISLTTMYRVGEVATGRTGDEASDG